MNMAEPKKSNMATALVLASVAIVFFVAVIVKRVWFS
ncbi:MAG: hypothetical protein RL748_1560 [Pseudomonadota bacterium]|jgi:hypothetical protein